MVCTPYNESIGYDAAVLYDGICSVAVCGYNDPVNYDAFAPYNGTCVTPQPTPQPTDVFGVYSYRPRRIEEDDPIALLLLELLDEDRV